MADRAIITRRSALVGAFSSLLVAPAAAAFLSDLPSEPIAPFDEVRFHAFALRDAMQKAGYGQWTATVSAWARTSDTVIYLHHAQGGLEVLYRPGDLPTD